jgi:SpoVK/Ycf46/Vps4 family AAA+-type ATPase
MDKKQKEKFAVQNNATGIFRHNKRAATWEQLASSHGAVAELRNISTDYRAGKRAIYLFTGANGTDKTIAAEVVANELGKDLLRIDLSAVVNKYIGETEKNLERMFAAAEQDSAVLLFDEADALFCKRSEVKDSHDRYANSETSYLLQRMETYSGIAILATNTKTDVDAPFLRRFRYVIDFPAVEKKT